MSVLNFAKKKISGEKISMVTCYDYTSARILAQTSVDCILVGDSAAMTMHGHPTTVSASLEMMQLHTAAVSRGAGNKFIIGDLPFLSYRRSRSKNVAAVQTLLQAGAHAIKLEGAAGNLALIRHLVESGVPVIGHIGLTPQSVNALGGYQVQGKTDGSAKNLLKDAVALQKAGCFAIVLECIPASLAQEITEKLSIPTIGIGAGPYTNGQVVVWQDMFGLNIDFKPKFVKHYLPGSELFKQGIEKYISEINAGEFPTHEYSY